MYGRSGHQTLATFVKLQQEINMAPAKKTAKRRASRRTTRRKKTSPLWQWFLMAFVAFGLYLAVDFYLGTRGSSPTDSPQAALQSGSEQDNNTTDGWSLEKARKFLPKGADPDHFEVYPLLPTGHALLSFGMPLKDKDSDPQGFINIRPGLSFISADGKAQAIGLSDLEPALGKELLAKLTGRAQVSSSLVAGDNFLIPIRFFLGQDEREVMAYLLIEDGQAKWAPLTHASGKKMPAAFWVGTTAQVARKVRHRKRATPYLIVEHGLLDEARAFEGFQWKTQAYMWDRGSFYYDEDYSHTLSQKQNSP